MSSVPPVGSNGPRVANDAGVSNGNPQFSWNLTEANLMDLVHLLLPPDQVLPVIFVPGIMGTNLKTTDTKDAPSVWRLDDIGGGIPTAARQWIWRSAGTRQTLLHPDRTAVDNGGSVPDECVGSVSATTEYTRRGWGEVGETSYQDFLLWLERTLNGYGANPALWPDFLYAGFSATPEPGEYVPPSKLAPDVPMRMHKLPFMAEPGHLVDSIWSNDLIARARYRMPVYACGYNWLASNNLAAGVLADKINAVIAENNRGYSKCGQVVLVTHSMGGLVARSCIQLDCMTDKIAGIVHGVMPALGAAVAYRRCKIGIWDEANGLSADGAALTIGRTGKEITAVFAQAPGALQLLPNQDYRPNQRGDWLRVVDPAGSPALRRPLTDPYKDIYQERSRWWGLVREAWLAPEGGIAIRWNDYAKNIKMAADYHAGVRTSYHPTTYVFYGADAEQPSFEGVTWNVDSLAHDLYAVKAAERTSTAKIVEMTFGEVTDTGENPLRICQQLSPEQLRGPYPMQPALYGRLQCALQDGVGDGTVPESSGSAPRRMGGAAIQQQFRLTGFAHEPAYHDPVVKQVALYSLMKIAAKAKVNA